MTTRPSPFDLNLRWPPTCRRLNENDGLRNRCRDKQRLWFLGDRPVAPFCSPGPRKSSLLRRPEEGVALRPRIGPGLRFNVFAGHMPETPMIRSAALTPMINSVDQLIAHVEDLPGHRSRRVQAQQRLNRLGWTRRMERAARHSALARIRRYIILHHRACADEPNHAMKRPPACNLPRDDRRAETYAVTRRHGWHSARA